MKLVQCWDDGVHDDIRVIEILRKHGAKASFNLNYGLHRAERQGGWSDRYQKQIQKLALGELEEVYAGFTVANHTLTHPHLTKLSPDEMAKEIRMGKDALEQCFGYEVSGFAYPYGDYDPTVQEAIRAAGHSYARTVRALDSSPFPPEDPTAFHPNCHFLAGDFWERFERAKTDNDPVFYFWGHSYELVTEDDWRSFDEKIARLTADPITVWTDLPELFAE